MNNTTRTTTTTLTGAETRAMNDFRTYPSYKGGAADAEALRHLETLGLLRSIEHSAGARPLYYLTRKGSK